jgi:hypothetical protein
MPGILTWAGKRYLRNFGAAVTRKIGKKNIYMGRNDNKFSLETTRNMTT